ncbi:MAG: PAS domain S-box protein [Proteobacteria bacterium]|nr:PAS domain S-box protein [Pseudomonadota bacterium]
MKDLLRTKPELIKEDSLLKQKTKELEESKTRCNKDDGTFWKSDYLYHAFFDLAPDPMAITDFDNGRIIDVNQAFVAWSHLSRDALISHTTTELGFWVNNKSRDAILDQLHNKGFVGNAEIELKRGRDELRQIIFFGKLIEIENNKCFLFVARDITERKLVEEALKQSEHKLSDIIEFLPDATFVIDADGKVIAWNRAIEQMTGVLKDEMIGMGNHEYAIPFYGHRRPLLIDLALLQDEDFERNHYEGIYRQGDTLYAEAYVPQTYRGKGASLWGTSSRLRDAYGNIVGAIESIRDITDHKRAEEKLKDSYEQLRMLSAHIQEAREKERTGIARELHDVLGQILTVINMDLSWMNKKIPAQEKELLGKVSSTRTLVKQAIKTVQKVSAGLRPIILDDFGIAEAIANGVKEFQDQTGIDASFTMDQTIDIDKESGSSLYRIFQEALTNVIRHAKATKLEVSLCKNISSIQLTVKDNGRGISNMEISDKKSFGILGMQERASFIGGHLEISGSKDLGTRIMVEIPLKKSEAEQ